jgi:hypothetical protein
MVRVPWTLLTAAVTVANAPRATPAPPAPTSKVVGVMGMFSLGYNLSEAGSLTGWTSFWQPPVVTADMSDGPVARCSSFSPATRNLAIDLLHGARFPASFSPATRNLAKDLLHGARFPCFLLNCYPQPCKGPVARCSFLNRILEPDFEST